MRGKSGPTRAAIERRARSGEVKGTCHVVFLFSALFISSSRSSSVLIVYSTTTCGTGRDGAGHNGTGAGGDSNEGQDRGADGREEEGDGWTGVLRRGGSGGSRGRVGRRSAAGDLRVGSHSVTGDEAKRVGQGGGWATLLLSCLPLGLETCYITTPLLSIDLVKIKQS